MKKFLFLIGFVFVLATEVFAQAGQTYYYRYIETIDTSTGVRTKGSPGGFYVKESMYITFTRNSCYESDERGIQAKNRNTGALENVLAYQGEQNNLYIYKFLYESLGMSMSQTFTFSKDYKRLNVNNISPFFPNIQKEVNIYEKADPPSKAPSTLY